MGITDSPECNHVLSSDWELNSSTSMYTRGNGYTMACDGSCKFVKIGYTAITLGDTNHGLNTGM